MADEVDSEFTIAAQRGDFEKVKSLAGAWFNKPDIEGWAGRKALVDASKKGHKEIVSFLLDNNAECNSGLILTELEHNHYDNIKKILDRGGNINYPQFNILYRAIVQNSIEYAKLLISYGADVNMIGENESTPLSGAIHTKDVSKVNLLIQHGADVNRRYSDGDYLIHDAIHQGDNEIVEALANAGADIMAENKYGLTPLHRAISRSKEDIFDYLLSKGAIMQNTETTNSYGDTALYGCTSVKMLNFMLNEGANAFVSNKRERTLLHDVCYGIPSASCEYVQVLIDEGLDVNAVDDDGDTPLMLCDTIDILKLLVESGADVNVQNKFGRTALIRYAVKGDIEAIQYLIDNDADITLKDEDGQDAQTYAAVRGKKEVSNFFREKKKLLREGKSIKSVSETLILEEPIEELSLDLIIDEPTTKAKNQGQTITKEEAIAKVKQYEWELEKLPEFQSDKDVVMVAVGINANVLETVSKELCDDRDVIKLAIRESGYLAFKYASDRLRADRELALKAVESHVGALDFLGDKYKNDKDFAIAANGKLEYFSDKIRDDKEVISKYVSGYGGMSLKHASERLKNDKEIVLEAVRLNGPALEFASVSLKANKEVVLTAIKDYKPALEFANVELQEEYKTFTSDDIIKELQIVSPPLKKYSDPDRHSLDECFNWINKMDEDVLALEDAVEQFEEGDYSGAIQTVRYLMDETDSNTTSDKKYFESFSKHIEDTYSSSFGDSNNSTNEEELSLDMPVEELSPTKSSDLKSLYAEKIASGEICPADVSFVDFEKEHVKTEEIDYKKLYSEKIVSGEIDPSETTYDEFLKIAEMLGK